MRFPALYRTTLSSLSVARDTSLDRALVTYLERLCTRAYFQIYGVQTPAWRQLTGFFARGWPEAVRRAVARDPVLRCADDRRGDPRLSADPAAIRAGIYSIIPEGLAGRPRSRPPRPKSCGQRSMTTSHKDSWPRRLRDLPVHPQQPDRDFRLRAGLRFRRPDASC